MKSVLRSIVINSFSLWATNQMIAGLRISGGFETILFGGFALTLMNLLVKPILSILTLPLTILTMGFSSWVLNVALVYLLTVLVPNIAIVPYTFPGMQTGIFSIPRLNLSGIQTTILVAFLLSFITNSLFWLFRR